MRSLTDALVALRSALKLAEDVRSVGASLKSVSRELRDHERRLTRLEAKWETAIEIASIRASSTRHFQNRD